MKFRRFLVLMLVAVALLSFYGCSCNEFDLYYTVEYLNFDGTVYKTVTVYRHKAAEAPELVNGRFAFVNDDETAFSAQCTFEGWETSTSNVTGHMVVKPVFTMSEIVYDSFLVTFIDVDEVTILDKQIVASGEAAVAPELTAPDGRVLLWDRPFDNVTSNLTVTARFVSELVDYIFDAGVGAFSAEGPSADGKTIVFENVRYDQTVDLTSVEIPSLDHHDFANWGTPIVEEDGAVVRYPAVYNIHTFTVTFLDAFGIVVSVVENVAYNTAVPAELIPAADTRVGYIFENWSEDIFAVQSDLVVSPIYRGRDVKFVFYNKDGSVFTERTGEYGILLNVVAPDVDGFTFIEWTYGAYDMSGEPWICEVRPVYMVGVWYKVAFVVNGQLAHAQSVAEDMFASDPATIVDFSAFIPEGKMIDHWTYTGADGLDYRFDFATMQVTSNMTLNAVFADVAP